MGGASAHKTVPKDVYCGNSIREKGRAVGEVSQYRIRANDGKTLFTALQTTEGTSDKILSEKIELLSNAFFTEARKRIGEAYLKSYEQNEDRLKRIHTDAVVAMLHATIKQHDGKQRASLFFVIKRGRIKIRQFEIVLNYDQKSGAFCPT